MTRGWGAMEGWEVGKGWEKYSGRVGVRIRGREFGSRARGMAVDVVDHTLSNYYVLVRCLRFSLFRSFENAFCAENGFGRTEPSREFFG